MLRRPASRPEIIWGGGRGSKVPFLMNRWHPAGKQRYVTRTVHFTPREGARGTHWGNVRRAKCNRF